MLNGEVAEHHQLLGPGPLWRAYISIICGATIPASYSTVDIMLLIEWLSNPTLI